MIQYIKVEKAFIYYFDERRKNERHTCGQSLFKHTKI